MKVTYLLPARDKRDKIELALKSALLQTYPCTIVISDQGSTDGTWPFIVEYCKRYQTHHQVILTQCPHVPPRSMSAFNVHINWLMSKVSQGIVLISSADDVAHEEKTAHVVECFEKHDPAMVLTAQEFVDPVAKTSAITAFSEKEGFVTGKQILEHLIGGSSTLAWTAEFFHKIGGSRGVIGIDTFLPFLAAQDKGCYWTPRVLHSYIKWADENNMGLGGVLAAADQEKDEQKKKQIAEMIQYQMTSVATALAAVAQDTYPNMSGEDRLALFTDIGNRAYGWARARDLLTEERIEPLRMAA